MTAKFRVILRLGNCPRIVGDELSVENYIENIIKDANVRNKISIQVEAIRARKPTGDRVTTTIMHPVKYSADLRKVAGTISEFYGLDVILEESDFNPRSNVATIRVVTPTGKEVVKLSMSCYEGAKYWSIGGQTFVTANQMDEVSALVRKSREEA